eukprot:sb/3470569/
MLSLSGTLSKTSQLETLDLSGSSFTGKGLRYLCDSLKQSCAMTLQSLSVARCPKIHADSWATFLELICHLVSLHKLNLADTSLPVDTIGQAGWKHIEKPIATMNNLYSLNLQGNDLNGELLEVLQVLEGHKGLRHLNISDNGTKLRDKKTLVNKLISLVENFNSTLISLDISNLKLKTELYPFLVAPSSLQVCWHVTRNYRN